MKVLIEEAAVVLYAKLITASDITSQEMISTALMYSQLRIHGSLNKWNDRFIFVDCETDIDKHVLTSDTLT